jgi:sugar fermentation stimulation protein A
VQFFFVSRVDVDAFTPAEDIDPEYAAGLRAAAAAGVEIVAYRARVRPDSLSLDQRLEVRLRP